MRFVAALPLLILSMAAVAHGQFGTKSLPALSCQALLSRGAKPSSGLYWIKPKGVAAAFQGYCDMETFGGGWLMCYSTNLHVHVSREVNSTVPYGSNGYRSDCRDYPFNHVMYVDHSAKISQHDRFTSVWFQFNGFGTIKASSTGYSGRLNNSIARFDSSTLGPTWTPHGGANIETLECRQAKAKWGTGGYVQADVLQLCGRRVFYQLLVCDNAIESDIGAPYYSNQQLFPGFMMTEYDGRCWMSCSDFCNDKLRDWYRTSCGADGCDGIAFKQNGFQNLPGEVLPGSYGDGRVLSVGIREGAEVSRPFRVGWPEQGQLSGYDAQYDWYAQKPSPETLKPLQG